MQASQTLKYNKLVKLSSGPYQAFLYDCDGTLADNMQAHADTYIKVAAEKGIVITRAIIDELAGWPTPDVVVEINKRYGSDFDPDEFNAAKTRLYHDKYIHHIKPIEFVVKHLTDNAGKVRIGVVSGGSREAISQTLEILNIAHLVEVMVCAGETPNGKPHPDPFLAAATQLGVAPQDCLVFEDGAPGVAASKAAGMAWIRIDQI